MTKIVYQWVKVSKLEVGWHIHIDGECERDYKIESLEYVGEKVVEIQAALSPWSKPIILHRKPTDEITVFGVKEDGV